MGVVVFNSSSNMRIFITLASLLALAECRRHLCDDGTRPICPDGTKAVYNRPTGKNTENSDYFPPPVCNGEGKPACADGSEARVRFNICSDDEKKCPTGQGFGAGDKPRPACADGSKCSCPGGGKNCAIRFKRGANRKSCVTQCKKGVPHCPGGGKNCAFRFKRCANRKSCVTQCKKGVPHCPWWTKNRNKHDGIRNFNTGERRPGNRPEGHHWGPAYPGNLP